MVLNMLAFYSPELQKFRQLEKLNTLMNVDKYKQYPTYSNSINQSFYNVEAKNIVLNFGMGSEKTSETIIYMKERLRVEPTLKVLVITPNITLSRGIYYRLNKMGLNFEHYNEEYKNKATSNKKLKTEMSKASKLIVCINSLHYSNENRFDIIICDEIETTLNKWFDNKTLNDNQIKSIESWHNFNDLFKQSQKNIFLDALTTNLSLDYISSLRDKSNTTENLDLKIFQRLEEKTDKQIINIDKFNQWLQLIIFTLKKNLKVLIY